MSNEIECIFKTSYTDKTGKLCMPPICKAKNCSGYDDVKKPKCELFIPIDIKEDKKIIKK